MGTIGVVRHQEINPLGTQRADPELRLLEREITDQRTVAERGEKPELPAARRREFVVLQEVLEEREGRERIRSRGGEIHLVDALAQERQLVDAGEPTNFNQGRRLADSEPSFSGMTPPGASGSTRSRGTR